MTTVGLTGRLVVVAEPSYTRHGDAVPMASRIRRGFTGHTLWTRGRLGVEQAFTWAWRGARGAVEPCEDPLVTLVNRRDRGAVPDLVLAFVADPDDYAGRCAAVAVVVGVPVMMLPPAVLHDLDLAGARRYAQVS